MRVHGMNLEQLYFVTVETYARSIVQPFTFIKESNDDIEQFLFYSFYLPLM